MPELKGNKNDKLFARSLVFAKSHEVQPIDDHTIAISVIIPCFNAKKFIKPCLESLSRQTLQQDYFEVICIDDCSTDETVSIIEMYKDSIKNLRVIKHTINKKQGAARNTGIEHAKGKYITFLDSDDYFRIDALEVLANSAKNHDLLLFQHILTRFDIPFVPKKSNRRIPGDLKQSAINGCIGWWPVGLLISRELINNNMIRFREGVFFEDIDFVVKVAFHSNTFYILNEAFYYYIQRGDSTVNLMNIKKIDDSILAVTETLNYIQHTFPKYYTPYKEQALSWLLLQMRRLFINHSKTENTIEYAEHLINAIASQDEIAFLASLFTDRIRTAFTSDYLRNLKKLKANKSKYTKELLQVSNPWNSRFNEILKDKIVFYCEANYHILSAVPIVRLLKIKGFEPVIIDATKSKSFTANRVTTSEQKKAYSDIEVYEVDVSQELPFSTLSKAFIFMNDVTYTKELIFENFGQGIPTIGFYEGINDDYNLDREAIRRPYRSLDALLLPGVYQAGFYHDRLYKVVGLPNVHRLYNQPYIPPKKRQVVINVNFTYGVLECRRDVFVKTAVQACQELEIDYVISQHPADKANLINYNCSKESVYDLIKTSKILISRFSTTILEALSMGRGVVYYNPVNEKVPKFKDSMDAYSTAENIDELKDAIIYELQYSETTGSTRDRALEFLNYHCNILEGKNPENSAADAIEELLLNIEPPVAFKKELAVEQINDDVTPDLKSLLTSRSPEVYPVFNKIQKSVNILKTNNWRYTQQSIPSNSSPKSHVVITYHAKKLDQTRRIQVLLKFRTKSNCQLNISIKGKEGDFTKNFEFLYSFEKGKQLVEHSITFLKEIITLEINVTANQQVDYLVRIRPRVYVLTEGVYTVTKLKRIISIDNYFNIFTSSIHSLSNKYINKLINHNNILSRLINKVLWHIRYELK